MRLPEPPLADAHVILRAWTQADAGALRAAADDPLVHRYRASAVDILANPDVWIVTAEEARLAGERLELAICDATHPETLAGVGSISLWGIHRRNRDAMLSWWLGAVGRGRGLGSAAVRALAAWAFEELEMGRLAASIEEDNASSRRLAERCGFRLEGRLRSYQRLPDGTRVDCLSYSLLPGELRAVR